MACSTTFSVSQATARWVPLFRPCQPTSSRDGTGLLSGGRLSAKPRERPEKSAYRQPVPTLCPSTKMSSSSTVESLAASSSPSCSYTPLYLASSLSSQNMKERSIMQSQPAVPESRSTSSYLLWVWQYSSRKMSPKTTSQRSTISTC